MKDLLRRLQEAMPLILAWMAELQLAHAGRARRASEGASPRLLGYWPKAILESSRVVIVSECPFPPVSQYGLPEFEDMAAMEMAGITFGNMYFLKKEYATESVHTHELVHVVQWGDLGLREFLFTYALGIAENG